MSYTDSLPPSRVEYKPDYINITSAMWEKVWDRVASPHVRAHAEAGGVEGCVQHPAHHEEVKQDENTRQVYRKLCNRCTHMFTECEQVKEARG